VGSVVYALLHAGAAPPSIAHETLAEIVAAADDPWAWVVATAAVAGAPVIEEFIYRGCLQSGLMAAGARVLAGWKDPSVDDAARAAWPAIIITSVIFTLMHAGNGGGSGDGGGGVPWHALPVLMVLSVVLGMAYARRGVLLTPVLAHAGFNAVNVAAALLISRNG
jgi:membrane protease YdiL (CAAX protease family)